METKLILIARVSDIEQRKALPAQKLRLERYAEQKQLPSEYHEFDESAHKDVRQKFSKLVDRQERCGECHSNSRNDGAPERDFGAVRECPQKCGQQSEAREAARDAGQTHVSHE